MTLSDHLLRDRSALLHGGRRADAAAPMRECLADSVYVIYLSLFRKYVACATVYA